MPMAKPYRSLFLPILVSSVLVSAPLVSQTLTPRAHWPAPAGTNLLSVGYTYQKGGVVTDPSLPVENVDSESHAFQASYLRFFSLAGRTASLSVEIPRVEASYSGLVEGEAARRTLSGFSDLGARLAVNLRGAPAMTPEEFREFVKTPDPILGASLLVNAPTGGYDPDKLINLSTNRWSAKPEIGYLKGFGSWITELSLGVRFFGDNDDFQGSTREQSPLAAAEFHIGRALRKTQPAFWMAFDVNYYYGARTRVDGVKNDDLQKNSRTGLTVVIPVGKRNVIKIATSTSLRASAAAEYSAVLLGYSRVWR